MTRCLKKRKKLKEYQKNYCEANKKAKSLNLKKKYMTISITHFSFF